MTSVALMVLMNLASPLAVPEGPAPEAAARPDEVAPAFDLPSLLALEGADVAVITNSDRNTTGLLVSVSDHALVISTVNGTQTFTSGEVIRVTPLGDHFAPDAGTYGTTRKYRAQKSERAATAWAFWDGLAIAGLIITPCAAGAFVLIPAVFVGPWTLLVSIPVAVALLGLAGYQAWRYFGASASRAEAAKRLSSSEEAMAY